MNGCVRYGINTKQAVLISSPLSSFFSVLENWNPKKHTLEEEEERREFQKEAISGGIVSAGTGVVRFPAPLVNTVNTVSCGT